MLKLESRGEFLNLLHWDRTDKVIQVFTREDLNMFVPALKLAKKSQWPVLDGPCMGGHHGKKELEDVLPFCLKVFCVPNGSFLFQYSDVSKRDLEAGEVPGECFKPQLHSPALVKSSWCKLPDHTLPEHLCPLQLSSYTHRTLSVLGTSQTCTSESQKDPFNLQSCHYLLVLGVYYVPPYFAEQSPEEEE